MNSGGSSLEPFSLSSLRRRRDRSALHIVKNTYVSGVFGMGMNANRLGDWSIYVRRTDFRVL